MMPKTPTSSDYIEARLAVPRPYVDAVCNFIIDNICSGLVLEEEDDASETTISFYVAEDDDCSFEDQLIGYLSSLAEQESLAVPEIRVRTIKATEWEEQYRQSVRPALIGDDIIIRPPWFEPTEQLRYDLIIEPRMAFGTGQHESTRSCLRAIRDNFQRGWDILDLGCGSGILAILADKMGASRIKAIDYDLIAVENCRENFAVNQVKAPAEIEHGSIEKCDGDQPYRFVVANIIKDTISEMLPRLQELTAPAGVLVLSGIIDTAEDSLSAQLRGLDMDSFEILRDNEWLTYVIRRV